MVVLGTSWLLAVVGMVFVKLLFDGGVATAIFGVDIIGGVDEACASGAAVTVAFFFKVTE